MKAIVHIGLPKTGTTSIQTWLRRNAAALRDRGIAYDRFEMKGEPLPNSQLEIGVCQYARAGQVVPNANTRRVFGLRDVAATRAFAARVEALMGPSVAAADPGATYVISSEHIGAWTKTRAHVEALDGWLAQYFDDVRYVVYIRRQEDWLLSRYSQTLRRGMSVPLEKFLRRNAAHDYTKMTDTWTQTVGRDRFAVRLMERDALVDGDLIADFAHVIGVDPTGLEVPERQNEALSVAAAEFLRVMNETIVPLVDGGKRRNPLLKGVEKHLTHAHANDRRLRVTEAQAQRIAAANAESNERLRQEFFPDRAELFVPKTYAPGDKGTNAPTAQEMALVGLALYRAARTGRFRLLPDHDIEALRAAEAGEGGAGDSAPAAGERPDRGGPGGGKGKRQGAGKGKRQGAGKGGGRAGGGGKPGGPNRPGAKAAEGGARKAGGGKAGGAKGNGARGNGAKRAGKGRRKSGAGLEAPAS